MSNSVFDIEGKITIDTSGVDAAMSKAKSSTDNFANSEKSAADAAESLTAKAVAAGKLIADAFEKCVKIIGKIGTDVVRVGADFETSMAKVQTIMNPDEMSFDAMSNSIKQLSSEMGVAASEISETVYSAISATGDTAHAVELAGNASKLAAAGFTDTGSALSVLTTAMNAYHLSAEQTEQISDSLIATQNLGVTTVAELSASMGKAIASASAYGVNLGNLEAGYVALTKSGISTAESTTYMSSMMKELGQAGSTVSTILQQQTGQSFGQLMSSGKSLGDVLQVLWQYCKGDSEAFMNLWSSVEAGKSASAIAGQGFAQFNGYLQHIQGSTGATAQAFSTMADTFNHQTAIMKTAIQNLGISFFDTFKGNMSDAVNGITEIVNGIADVFNGDDGGVARIRAGAEQMVVAINEMLPKIAEALNPVIDAIAQVFHELISKIDVSGAVSEILVNIAKSLPKLLWDFCYKLASDIVDYLKDLPSRIIKGIFGGGGGEAPEIDSTQYESFGTGIARGVVTGYSNGMQEYMPQAISGSTAYMTESFTKFATTAEQAGGAGGQGFATGYGRYAATGINTANTQVQSTMSADMTALANTAQTAGQQTAQAYGAGFQAIETGTEQSMQSVTADFTQSCAAINSAMQNVDSTTLSHLNNMVQQFVNAGNSFASAMRSSGTAMVQAIEGALAQMASAVNQQLGSVTSTINSWGNNAVNAFRQIGQNIVQGLIQGIQSGQSALSSAINSMVQSTVGQAQQGLGIHSPSKVFRDQIGQFIPKGVAAGIADYSNFANNAITAMSEGMIGTYSGRTAMDSMNTAGLETQMGSVMSMLGQYLPNMGGDLYMDGDKVGERIAQKVDTMLGRRAIRLQRGGTR